MVRPRCLEKVRTDAPRGHVRAPRGSRKISVYREAGANSLRGAPTCASGFFSLQSSSVGVALVRRTGYMTTLGLDGEEEATRSPAKVSRTLALNSARGVRRKSHALRQRLPLGQRRAVGNAAAHQRRAVRAAPEEGAKERSWRCSSCGPVVLR